MLTSTIVVAVVLALPFGISASPVRRWSGAKSYYDYFDLQGHRGTRGAIVERYV
jgi:hypothetical protein